ncbi:MAG TPA: phosphomannomutase [Gammaproteobacteria bacterium]|nr:phosphomannomutase [Gammaproteobacteria bacterium]
MLKKKIQKIHLAKHAELAKVKFGTSGIRGLNSHLTDKLCYIYTIAFLNFLENSKSLEPEQHIILAGDLRDNTDHILRVIQTAIEHKGFKVEYAGKIPTPALGFYCLHKNSPGLIVTGSHIPNDMNGIKFYKADGEILKSDEKSIVEQTITINASLFDDQDQLLQLSDNELTVIPFAYHLYAERYFQFFSADALGELKIGIYAHSSVALDTLSDIFQKMGATLYVFGKSKSFHSIDTESLSHQDHAIAMQYMKEYKLDMIVSTDGDGDRPMLSDEHGVWLRGDIIGMLTALILQANFVVTPYTSNSSVEHIRQFKHVYRTKIGSPYIVEKINALIDEGKCRIIGYEANGGVLVGTDFQVEGKILKALPTRDSLISLLTIITHAKKSGLKISELVKKHTCLYTESQSIADIPSEESQHFLAKLTGDMQNHKIDYFKVNAAIKKVESLDGLRIYYENGEIVHLRPSGNASELRCYTEASTPDRTKLLNEECVRILKTQFKQKS